MSFYEELKRRNVAKVAVLYIIAAWLLLQVTDVLSSLLTVPEWTGSLVVLLLLLGFFPVMIFSWVYEMTPEGLKKEKDIDRSQSITPVTGRKINTLIIVMLALAIAAVVADRLIPEATTVSGETVATESDSASAMQSDAPEAAPDHSIAVLPFVNMSSDIEQEYFSDGLSEELLNLLAKIPDLQVAARTSSFSYKGKDTKVATIGEELNVGHVLEGSVRKSGNQVRITAQLIQASDGFHLWSETYDRTLDDIFAVQDEIAIEVVAQLKVTLLGEVPTVEETDPKAYALYLQARHLARQGTAEAYEQSIALYQKALTIVPDYAAAWTGLSSVYGGQALNGLRPIDEAYELAREAANKALAINPDYAPAHAALAPVASNYDNDLAAATRHVERALALAPTDQQILGYASGRLMALGRLDEGIQLQGYLIARDPVNPHAYINLGLYYLYAGRSDDAIPAYQTAIDLNPGFIAVHYRYGESLLLKGDPEAALAAFQREEADEEYRVKGTALALHALGRQAEFEAAFSELRERWGEQWPSEIAHVYAWTGDADAAFEWLDKSVAQNEDGLADQFNRPFYAPLHDDPRWLAFRERTGTSEAQLAAIEFDVTIPE